MAWFGIVLLVWFGMGGVKGQMTSEFIHEEISIMDYNGLSWGGSSWTIIDCQGF